MPTHWRIEISLGDAAGAAPIRSLVVDAETEVEALQLAVAEAERDRKAHDELLQDGQEEVFSRTEVQQGAVEHPADTD